MKATIKKVRKRDGDNFYRVLDAKGEVIVSFYFKPECEDLESVMHPDYALKEAQDFAKRMESGELDKDIEEIVYQTPDDIPADLYTEPGNNH